MFDCDIEALIINPHPLRVALCNLILQMRGLEKAGGKMIICTFHGNLVIYLCPVTKTTH